MLVLELPSENCLDASYITSSTAPLLMLKKNIVINILRKGITRQIWLQIRAFSLIGKKKDLTPTSVKLVELSAQVHNVT